MISQIEKDMNDRRINELNFLKGESFVLSKKRNKNEFCMRNRRKKKYVIVLFFSSKSNERISRSNIDLE